MDRPDPSMRTWSECWRNSDVKILMYCYAEDAALLHPRRATIVGREAIIDFLRAGVGQLDVLFLPRAQVIEGDMAFEYGEFRDKERSSGDVIGRGSYFITWIWRDNRWQILGHNWNGET